MKKLFAILLVVLVVASLCACKDNKNSAPGTDPENEPNNPKVEAFVQENKATLVSTMEQSFASSASGMTCTSSIEVKGSGFVMKINIHQLDNVTADMKEQLQTAYDAMSSIFENALKDMQKELPELKYFKVLVCDKDGEVLATIQAGK